MLAESHWHGRATVLVIMPRPSKGRHNPTWRSLQKTISPGSTCSTFSVSTSQSRTSQQISTHAKSQLSSPQQQLSTSSQLSVSEIRMSLSEQQLSTSKHQMSTSQMQLSTSEQQLSTSENQLSAVIEQEAFRKSRQRNVRAVRAATRLRSTRRTQKDGDGKTTFVNRCETVHDRVVFVFRVTCVCVLQRAHF